MFRSKYTGLSAFVFGIQALAATPLGAAPVALHEPLRNIELKDVLGIERIGRAIFSDDGHWLIYNMVPPYDELLDYSYGLSARNQSGHQVWIVDLGRNAPPKRQPGLDTGATNFIVDISPDQKRLVVMEHKLGRFRFATCAIGKSECVWFDRLPDILDMYVSPGPWNQHLVWTSKNTFVFPTRDRFSPGSEMRSRGIAGEYLTKAWKAAWRGDTITSIGVISTQPRHKNDQAKGELVEFNIETGAERSISNGRYAGIRYSNDLDRLAAVRLGDRERPKSDAGSEIRVTHPPFDRQYALEFLDPHSRSIERILPDYDVDPLSITWSLNGESVAVFGWDRTKTPSDGQFFLVDGRSGRLKVFDRKGLTLANSFLDPDMPLDLGPARMVLNQSGLFVFAKRDEDAGYNWFLLGPHGEIECVTKNLRGVSGDPLYASESGIVVQTDDGVFQVGAGNHERALVTRPGVSFHKLDAQYNAAHSWSFGLRFGTPQSRPAFGRHVAVVGETTRQEGDQLISILDLNSSEIARTDVMIPFQGAKTLAASFNAGAALVSVKQGAATRLLLVRNNRAPRELARINSHLNQVKPPKTRQVEYTLEDPSGTDTSRQIHGCLILPPNFQAGKKYPLLLDVYPIGAERPCTTVTNAASVNVFAPDLWAAKGMIYFQPALPLDLAKTQDGPIAGMGEIVDQTVDALVSQGYVDPERMALFGFSQGGVLALSIASQSDRFAAIISINGWADYLSHYFGARGLMRYFHLDQNGGDNRWRYECSGENEDNLCPFGFGTTPFDDPSVYARTSPIVLARELSSPILLVHSDLDYIEMGQYDEMFGALYRAGKEARYVRYFGEGHGPSSPANIRDLWDRIDRFLEDYGIVGR